MTVQSVLLFVAYLAVGIALLAAFVYVYTGVTPYDERADIQADKRAPAIALAGAMLGFTVPLLVASFHAAGWGGLLDFVIWGAAAGLVQVACYWILCTLMPNTIDSNNVAGGIVYGAAAVCVGLLNGFAMIP